jgi:hypothetical protein
MIIVLSMALEWLYRPPLMAESVNFHPAPAVNA